MPKIKPTTLFCKRTLPILLVDDSPKDSLVKAAMLIQPLVDELVKRLPKADPQVLHVEDTGNAVYNAMATIDVLSTITEPTIVVTTGPEAAMDHQRWKALSPEQIKMSHDTLCTTSDALEAYIKFLVAAGGGFVIHVTPMEQTHDLNAALPILCFNPNRDSFMDIEYKVQTIIKRLVTADSINHHMTIQSVVNNSWLHNKLALCLGSWDRSMGDEVEGKDLKLVVNVKGISGSPISPEEFIHKVWCHHPTLVSMLNPANALVVRNPSIESKLVLAKILPNINKVQNIKFVEV